ncbi:sphingomyelin phosphodiesterase 1 isoform X1 [Leptinotarsa decemlineata]|uniref:sphingomyelin phosphodiesterase 1 isoform X1 n=1 Tax=Leptinotarsa decemlineata TaxID=7539 RepID=UPI003D30444C
MYLRVNVLTIFILIYTFARVEPRLFENTFDNGLHNLQKQLASHFRITNYREMEMEKFKEVLDNLNILGRLKQLFDPDRALCGICQLLITQIQRRTLTIRNVGEALCNIYITLSTWTVSNFCANIINKNMPVLEYIVNNSKILDPEFGCSVILQNKKCYYPKPALKWKISVPPISQKKIPQITANPESKPLKILHLTDFHISLDYEIGGVSDCGYPTCCKKNIGNPIRGRTAGPWGDYNCDLPPWVFGETLRHINSTHPDIDIIYFTGDVIDHSLWETSEEGNTKLIYYAYKALFETFKNKSVLSVIGNHEAVPLNVFAPPNPEIEEAGLSSQWMYTLFSKVWKPWLAAEALRTVKSQGYYALEVNSKLKIIALNNNLCYNYNWWVLYDTNFLLQQIKFLCRELQESEKKDQFVHIIAHVPVGNKECIEPWEENFNAIVERFSHIIKGQFYGHTHTDEMKIFYDSSKAPVNLGYNGASLTPWVKFNPNYKIITVDPTTYDVLDIDTYIFNLAEANANPEMTPRWFKLYSMKEAYGLDHLTPEKFDQLAVKMFRNNTLTELYWRFSVRDGDLARKDGCNRECKKELLCRIVTTRSLAPSKHVCN